MPRVSASVQKIRQVERIVLSNPLLCSFSMLLLFLPSSPFEVQVGPEAGMQKVRAWGPGLHGGIVGRSADFVVESIGSEVGTLGKWRQLPNRFCKAKDNTVPSV